MNSNDIAMRNIESSTEEWITIDKAIPHQHQDVYVCRTGYPRCAFPAHYANGEFHIFDMMSGVCTFANPTHWMTMSIPGPPNAED